MLSHSFDGSRPDSADFEGTVVYAAPEQLQGQPQRSSDQYALAVVAYEWLTGEWPFKGAFNDIAHQHLFDLPPRLRRKGLDIPPGVERVILKALEKDPERRFENVKTFADELEWASTGEATMLVRAQPKKQFRSPLPFVVRVG
jgi:serine/threonine protein kinase